MSLHLSIETVDRQHFGDQLVSVRRLGVQRFGQQQ